MRLTSAVQVADFREPVLVEIGEVLVGFFNFAGHGEDRDAVRV
ncbi:MAG TPA: hypothetical protein VGL82_15145 [Bryobacteraceae bacterium]